MERTTMTVKEAATYIGVHSDTIRAMVREKKIPHVRVRYRILFRKETLDAWMTQQEQLA